MRRPRLVRRLAKWIVTNARILGATIFTLAIILTRLSKPFHDSLEKFHEDFANNVDAACLNIRNFSAETVRLMYDRHDLIPVYLSKVFLEPPISSILKDAMIALLDTSSAAWHMCIALLRLYLHFVRGVMRISHTCFPHVSPLVFLCAEEFAALPLRGQAMILSSMGVNALAFVAWRRGWLAKAMSVLSSWHQRVAQTLVAFGPYSLVFALLYLPTKNALSFSSFRVAFQWTAVTAMLLQSLAACGQIWNAKSQQPPIESLSEASSTPAPPFSARTDTNTNSAREARSPPRNISITPRVEAEKRQQISSLLTQALNYWALTVCWQLVMHCIYMFLEYLLDSEIPVFNFWNLSSTHDIATHRVVLTRQSILDNSVALLDHTDLASKGFGKRYGDSSLTHKILVRLAWMTITLDEVVSLFMILISIVGDQEAARFLRKTCTGGIEVAIRQITGLDIRLIPSRSLDSHSTEGQTNHNVNFLRSLFVAWTQTEHTRRFTRLFAYADRLVDLLRHFAVLTLLVLPVFILRWVLLAVALIIPAIYSLKCLWSQQFAVQAYWLCYFTGLVVCLALGDTLATSSSLAGYLLSGIRPKLAVVCLLQFICVEPQALGTWVARQATRVSVSAIATARRRVAQTPSTLPPKSPASAIADSAEDLPRPRRESAEYARVDDTPQPAEIKVSQNNVRRRPSEVLSHNSETKFARSLSTKHVGHRKFSDATTAADPASRRDTFDTRVGGKRKRKEGANANSKRSSSQEVERNRKRASYVPLTDMKSK